MDNQRINLNKLYYFYVVAKEGSIKRASERLHLTQPTISGQIRQLEEELGFDVFNRKHRKLEVNPKGQRVLDQAEEIFKLADQLKDQALSAGRNQRESVKIGAMQSLSSSFINDFSSRIWRDKSIRFEIEQAPRGILVERLNQSKIDLLLSDGPLFTSKKFRQVPLAHDKVVAVDHPKLSLSKEKFPENLNEAPFVAFSNKSQLVAEIDYFFERSGVNPEIAAKVDDISLMRTICENSKFFSILPYRSVRQSLRDKKLVKLGTLTGVESTLWATIPRVSQRQPLINRLLKDYLK
jgi:LysR family transcriptional activator of nhaA